MHVGYCKRQGSCTFFPVLRKNAETEKKGKFINLLAGLPPLNFLSLQEGRLEKPPDCSRPPSFNPSNPG